MANYRSEETGKTYISEKPPTQRIKGSAAAGRPVDGSKSKDLGGFGAKNQRETTRYLESEKKI